MTFVFRNNGFFSWPIDDTDEVAQACADICERLAGYSDQEINEAIQAYLKAEYDKRRLN
jgi:hypothetical protein